MKKILLASLMLAAAAVSHATVTINFAIGVLSDNTGTPIADGSLIQIIGSSDNAFAAPTAGAFVGGNDTLLYSWSLDSSTFGDPGTGAFSLVATIPATTNLLLRWFPTLTTASLSPGGSTAYGQYGSLTNVAWVVPSDGSLVGINFLTATAGGSELDTVGRATLTTAAIPEPSTYAAIFGALALGLAAYRRRAVRVA